METVMIDKQQDIFFFPEIEGMSNEQREYEMATLNEKVERHWREDHCKTCAKSRLKGRYRFCHFVKKKTDRIIRLSLHRRKKGENIENPFQLGSV